MRDHTFRRRSPCGNDALLDGDVAVALPHQLDPEDRGQRESVLVALSGRKHASRGDNGNLHPIRIGESHASGNEARSSADDIICAGIDNGLRMLDARRLAHGPSVGVYEYELSSPFACGLNIRRRDLRRESIHSATSPIVFDIGENGDIDSVDVEDGGFVRCTRCNDTPTLQGL